MGFGASVSRISTNLNYYTTDPICIVNNLIDKIVYNGSKADIIIPKPEKILKSRPVSS